MRRILETFYRGSGGLAAVFLVLTCATVLTQVVFNLISMLADRLFGIAISLVLPSYADFAGYFFAASMFLGLGYSHHARAHIRVSILAERSPAPVRVALELWCLGVSVLLTGYLAYRSILLVVASYRFGDLSFGLVAVPLWIPQLAIAGGALVLTVALLDDLLTLLVAVVRGEASETVQRQAGTPLLEGTANGGPAFASPAADTGARPPAASAVPRSEAA